MTFDVQAYCLSRPEATEHYAQGAETPVYRVCHKTFAQYFVDAGEASTPVPCVNLKCDPDQARALREQYPSIVPGHHMNKKHWNTVKLDGTVPEAELQRLVDLSYALVVQGLPTPERLALEQRHSPDALYRAL